MPKVFIEAEVELQQYAPFIIHYSSTVKNKQNINNGRGEWGDLDINMVTWNGNTVNLPIDQFEYRTKVMDVVRASWNGGFPQWKLSGDPQNQVIPPNSIFIILESPHEDEYNYSNGKLVPIEPLMDEKSQKLFQCHIVRLVLAAAAKKQVTLRKNVSIVLCNPIQFQTSLHRLIRKTPPLLRMGLHRAIRNATWKALWEFYDIVNCRFPFQEDFIVRLNNQTLPCLVINACTFSLKEYVNDLIKNRFPNLPLVETTEHPSVWGCKTFLR